MWPYKKYFSHPRLVIYYLATPLMKLKTGTANRSGTTNSKPPGPIVIAAQSEHWASVRSYLLHSFLRLHSAAVSFTSHPKPVQLCWPKTISWAKPAHFGFSSSNFTVHAGSYSEHRWRCSNGVIRKASNILRMMVQCYGPKGWYHKGLVLQTH
jgi:hypothetical protein